MLINLQGQVEAGMKKAIVFTWTPPPKQDVSVISSTQNSVHRIDHERRKLLHAVCIIYVR